MLISLLVSLYTSRLVLSALGVEDFGIFNVVGSIIAVCSLLTGTMSGGTQRFLSFELAKGGNNRLLSVFTTSLSIYIAIGIIIVLVSETIGLWFLNSKLVIPENRIYAANIVFQISIVSMLVSLIQIPYTGAIIAHERMNIYGYLGIIEPIIRLVFVLILGNLNSDRLIFYAIFSLISRLLIVTAYIIYCSKIFPECRFKISKDWPMYKELIGFTSYNLIEVTCNELRDQGQNVLLNIFFGPLVNAARAISVSVNSAVRSFASNFQTAINPQIVKDYASQDYKNFHSLMIRGAKISFMLLSVLIIPILINTDYILILWLDKPPELAAVFCQLCLIATLIRTVSEPLYNGIMATGQIRNYQFIVGAVMLLNIPICYALFKLRSDPILAFVVNIFADIILVSIRVAFIHKLANFPVKKYVKMIFTRCILVFIVAYSFSYLFSYLFSESILNLLSFSIISVVLTIIIFSIFSLDRQERSFIIKLVLRK